MKTFKQGNDITIIFTTIKIIATVHRVPTVLKAFSPHTHPMRSEQILNPLGRGGAETRDYIS